MGVKKHLIHSLPKQFIKMKKSILLLFVVALLLLFVAQNPFHNHEHSHSHDEKLKTAHPHEHEHLNELPNHVQSLTHSHSSTPNGFCAIAPPPNNTTILPQPDGSTLTISVVGTASTGIIETVDGYTIVKDTDGYYKYAKAKTDGGLTATPIIAHDAAARNSAETSFLAGHSKHITFTGQALLTKQNNFQAAAAGNTGTGPVGNIFPATGNRKALMILIKFTDHNNTYTNAQFDNLCNQNGYSVNGNNGSFKDYYFDVSNNLLTITTDVEGWYTSNSTRATYGYGNGFVAAVPLVRQAVDAAEAAGVDFSQYDGDNDGAVDVVMIMHSGRGREESGDNDDIWSHRWTLGAASQSVTYDGKLINDYIIQAERYSASNLITHIGVLCHEFGHALGWPDLYDTDNSNGTSAGIGDWCLMAGGTWNNNGRTPAEPSAWCKNDLGWITPTVLTGSGTITNMDYVGGTTAEYYKFTTPVTGESFLLENRQKIGWDAFIDGEGLAIWHIDDNQNSNADETHKLVDLEEADGLADLDANANQGDAGDLYPGSSNNVVFNASSNPNSNTYSGASSGITVHTISETGNNVTFTYGSTVPNVSCGTLIQSFPYSESFENTTGAWTNASGDDFDWINQTGSTVSGSTGPAAAFDGSYYMYTEASSPNYPAKTAIFESPCFDLTQISNGNYYFGFYNHLYGAAMGTLDLQIKSSSTGIWASIWSKTGDHGNNWLADSVNLAAYSTDTVILRFIGTTGISHAGDMAVDKISIGSTVFPIASGEVCITALQITGTGTYTTNGPGTGSGCFNCSNNATDADWWTFTAPSNGTMDISSCLEGIDTRFWVYSGSCAGLTLVASNDDECLMVVGGTDAWAAEETNITAVSGTTYYIEWDNNWSNSGFDFDFTFNATFPCSAPSNLGSSNIGTTTADVSWTAASNATNYTVEWRVSGASTWNSATTSNTNYSLSSLTAATLYEWRITSNCNGGSTSASATQTFTTSAAPFVNITPTTISVSHSSGSSSINMNSNTNWTITSNDTWITVSAGSGSNNGSFNAMYSTNTGASRIGTITVSATGVGSQTITLTQAAPISSSHSSVNVTCNGTSTGSINLTISGGVSSYSYLWSNNATTEDLTNISAGSYTCTITDGNTTVYTTNAIIITEPSAITFTNTPTNVSCNNGNDGAITLSPSGGNSGYTYLWSNNSTTQNLTGLSAGTYTCTITDASNCQKITTPVTITQPNILTVSESSTNISCNGLTNGAINLNVSGGTSGYTYLWSNNATTQNLTGLSAGTYTCTVTDSKGCTVSTNTVTITAPAALLVTETPTNASCNGASDGCVNLNITGGTPNYIVTWSNGMSNPNPCGLAAGTYSYTVTDANGCNSTNSVTINQPNAISTTNTVTNVSCNGGTDGGIDLTATGGASGFTYLWSNNTTSEDLTNVGAGTYTCTVTDANGCQFTTFTIIVTEPQAITFSQAVGGVSCNGGADGSIDITPLGGASGFTYLWSNNATTEDLTGLSAGSYSCTITDASGCSITTPNLFVTEPTAISLSDTTVQNQFDGTSPDGSIDITIGGGTPPYSYLWSNNAITEDISNLTAGSYTVTVTDNNGCQFTLTIDINSQVSTDKLLKDATVKAFPNPTSGMLQLNVENIQNGDWSLAMVNVLGQEVYSEQLNIANQTINKSLSLNHLTNGVYWLKLINNDGEFYRISILIAK